ncbi:MAG: hypothetical protein M0Z76_02550 [Gammaproteobacteria bacterium]|nr:hypothetical protein [Gammaproteobacteria bacterium]
MNKVVIGVVIDDQLTLSGEELCGRSHLTAEDLGALVDMGVITPLARNLYPENALHRARRARRLKQGLDLEWETVAVLVDLLQEIDTLKRRLGTLEALTRR